MSGELEDIPLSVDTQKIDSLIKILLEQGDVSNSLSKLTTALDVYQEDPYLLDPHLESWLEPIALQFRRQCLSIEGASIDSQRLDTLSAVLYHFAKVRGYKIITRFLSHEVADLGLLLALFDDQNFHGNVDQFSWQSRYILLLWFSLVCRLPFNLTAWDHLLPSTSSTSSPVFTKIEQIGVALLDRPGKERDAAANLLGVLLSRPDTQTTLIESFLASCSAKMHQSRSLFFIDGLVQCICRLFKLCNPATLSPVVDTTAALLADAESLQKALNSNWSNRYEVKAAGRLALLLLSDSSEMQADSDLAGNQIQAVLDRLEDRDSAIRYAAAKYIARIAARLPPHSVDDLLDSITETFSNTSSSSSAFATSATDNAWNGACLAIAELARARLLPASRLSQVVPSILRALHIDIRKGRQSIGSSIRDAASYACWSFGRAFQSSDLKPCSEGLATELVAAALFDRDVQIRRSASAAFQELAGRLDIFPHGIDVLQRVNFYSISVRRSAFLTAAPSVAEFTEYRSKILDYLFTSSLTHYDPEMRMLGATAIASITSQHDQTWRSLNVEELVSRIVSINPAEVHGALSLCAQMVESMTDQNRIDLYQACQNLSDSHRKGHNSAMMIESTCRLLSVILIEENIQQNDSWRAFVALGQKRPEETCHRAAVQLLQTAATFLDYAAEMKANLRLMDRATMTTQPALVLSCGAFDLNRLSSNDQGVFLGRMLKLLDASHKLAAKSIESRKNALEVLGAMQGALQARPTDQHDSTAKSRSASIMEALLAGLADYTTDMRGDVGAKCRMACIQAFSSLLLLPNFNLNQDQADKLIASLLKQTLEKIDAVREKAGELLSTLVRRIDPPLTLHRRSDLQLLANIYGVDNGRTIDKVFSATLPLLDCPVYRQSILQGLLSQFGQAEFLSPTSMTIDLQDYLKSTAPSARQPLVDDLLRMVSANDSAQAVPACYLLAILARSDLLDLSQLLEYIIGKTSDVLEQKKTRKRESLLGALAAIWTVADQKESATLIVRQTREEHPNEELRARIMEWTTQARAVESDVKACEEK